MKKVLAFLMVALMVVACFAFAGCKAKDNGAADQGTADQGTADQGTTDQGTTDQGSTGSATEIIVWCPEEVVALTQTKLNEWLAGSEYAGKYTITVSAMGEGEATTQMLTDVEAGADVFGFAQDQLARLVAAGALSAPGGSYLSDVQANNDAGAVGAATLNEKVWAYPETSDNGYFLYYDKSVVTDPSTLEGILEQCGAAGKKMYMDIQSGWYDVSFFFGAGAQCYYEYDTEGNVTGCVCDYSGDAGLIAMKAMVAMASSPNFSQSTGSDAALFNPDGGTAGAIVSGTWDYATVSEFLGDNLGACKMPTFTVDGKTYQMGGFGGFKLVGVKPQTDSDKLTFCHAVAAYLTSEEMQTERFNANGWGPSNKAVQATEGVQQNAALAALADQLQYCIGQGQYPNAYWTLTEAFGTDINSGMYAAADDATLSAALAQLQADIEAAS